MGEVSEELLAIVCCWWRPVTFLSGCGHRSAPVAHSCFLHCSFLPTLPWSSEDPNCSCKGRCSSGLHQEPLPALPALTARQSHRGAHPPAPPSTCSSSCPSYREKISVGFLSEHRTLCHSSLSCRGQSCQSLLFVIGLANGRANEASWETAATVGPMHHSPSWSWAWDSVPPHPGSRLPAPSVWKGFESLSHWTVATTSASDASAHIASQAVSCHAVLNAGKSVSKRRAFAV